MTPLLCKMAEGLNLKKAAKACSINPDSTVTTMLPIDAKLPWDAVHSAERDRLEAEYRAAMQVIGVRV